MIKRRNIELWYVCARLKQNEFLCVSITNFSCCCCRCSCVFDFNLITTTAILLFLFVSLNFCLDFDINFVYYFARDIMCFIMCFLYNLMCSKRSFFVLGFFSLCVSSVWCSMVFCLASFSLFLYHLFHFASRQRITSQKKEEKHRKKVIIWCLRILNRLCAYLIMISRNKWIWDEYKKIYIENCSLIPFSLHFLLFVIRCCIFFVLSIFIKHLRLTKRKTPLYILIWAKAVIYLFFCLLTFLRDPYGLSVL